MGIRLNQKQKPNFLCYPITLKISELCTMHGFGSWKLFPPIFLNGRLISPEMATKATPSSDESWEVALFAFLNRWYSEAPTMEFFTSGTTGEPKRIELSKDVMRASARQTISFFQLEAGSRALLCIHPQYIGGAMMLVRAMEGGLHLDAVAPQNLSKLFPINQKYHFVAMAPLQAEKLTQQLGSTWTSSFQHILLGGTGLSESQQTMFAQLPAEKMWMGFGMTETSSHIALQSLSNLAKGFQLLPGIEARTNEEGCLQVRGAITENKWLSTNDLVELKSNLLTFLGRIDDQINSGGVKISPVQVEKMILANLEKRSIPSFEFAVSSVKDESLGEALVFVSQQKPPFNWKDVNVGLPTYHNLKKSYVVKNFPLNEQGKLNRKQLKIILESCHPTTP